MHRIGAAGCSDAARFQPINRVPISDTFSSAVNHQSDGDERCGVAVPGGGVNFQVFEIGGRFGGATLPHRPINHGVNQSQRGLR